MSSLANALADYLALRRSLGFKLTQTARELPWFVQFIERRGATAITTELALQWAQEDPAASSVTHADRLAMVRRFAAWRSAADPRTGIPPARLLTRRYTVAPDPALWLGPRDRTLLLLMVQTGLRVSELRSLRGNSVALGAGAHVRCEGKGRKCRCTPLRRDVVMALGAWLDEQRPGPEDPLFPSSRGGPMSTDAVGRLVAKHARVASTKCPSIADKNVTPHTLRHSAAMALREGGADLSVIALWLGHESVETTQMYLHADLRLKEHALARTASTSSKVRRFKPREDVLAFLESL